MSQNIALLLEAASTSETLVNDQLLPRYTPLHPLGSHPFTGRSRTEQITRTPLGEWFCVQRHRYMRYSEEFRYIRLVMQINAKRFPAALSGVSEAETVGTC